MDAIKNFVVGDQGILGLSRDISVTLIFLIAMNVTLPIVYRWLQSRRWRALRRNLAVMIGTHHNQMRGAIQATLAKPPSEKSCAPLDEGMKCLQRDIGNYGFVLDAKLADRVGSYWADMHGVWHLAMYGSEKWGTRRVPTFDTIETKASILMRKLGLREPYWKLYGFSR